MYAYVCDRCLSPIKLRILLDHLHVCCHRLSACLQLSAWRCRGKVALGADVTGCLRQAQQRDQAWCAARARQQALRQRYGSQLQYNGAGMGVLPHSDHELRLQYALPIIR